MDEVTEKVLVSTKAFLEELVKAGGLSSDHLTEAHLAVTALGYEIARARYDVAEIEKARAAERALADGIRDLIETDSAQLDVKRKWTQRWKSGVGAELAAILSTEHFSAGEGRADVYPEVAQRLRDFLVAYHEPLDPAVSAGTTSAYQGGRGDAKASEDAPITLTAESFQEYLRQRFDRHKDTVVTDAVRLMGGYSKETYIVSLRDDVTMTKMVIRKDGFGLPTGSSVVNEYPVLQQAHAIGVPTPQPLWIEEGDNFFGAAFMAVGFSAGEPAHLSVPADPGVRRTWSDSIAVALAKLHRETARPQSDASESIRAEIVDLQRQVEERERDPHPGISFGLSWLTHNLSALDGRPTCRTHGDAGFHNMIMQDGNLLALLDWEFSHYSDPVEDLAYVKPFIEQLDLWPSFLARYEAESTFRYDPVAARYFEVWKEVRNAVACLGSLNTLLIPQVKSLALSVSGNIYIPKFEIAILDAILNGEKHNE